MQAKKSQCRTLFQDIQSIAVSENRFSHFMGTIVYVEGEFNATFRAFTVIDVHAGGDGSIERNRSKETVEFDSLTIEHIMPQTLTAKWKIDLGKRAQEIYNEYLHCLGNLTLSGYNSELSNASFNEKQVL